MSDVVRQLPPAFLTLAPELSTLRLPGEKRATCTDCAMAPKPGANPDLPWSFTSPIRCCTYKPSLPNFIVGRILRRGDEGTKRMLARLADPEGIGPGGVGPSRKDAEDYAERAEGAFGRDERFRCPYWSDPGPHHCSIWQDRGAVCRTWFCKHEDGSRGRREWMALKDLLDWMEKVLGAACIRLGTPPRAEENPGVAEWSAWFVACADRIDALTPADLEAVKDDRFRRLLLALRAAAADREGMMPRVLVPTVSERIMGDETVWLSSYSGFDMHEHPRTVFVLLSRMTDDRTWKEGLKLAEADLGRPIGEGLVRELYKAGLLSTPVAGFEPGARAVARHPPRAMLPQKPDSFGEKT